MSLETGFTSSNQRIEFQDLSPEIQDRVAKYISSEYDRLDDAKQTVKKSWEDILPTVHMPNSYIDENSKTNLVPLHVQVQQTVSGHFWARSFQTPSMLFNVLGLDEDSQNYAPLYKSNVVDFLNKDKFQIKMNTFVETDGIPKGICIAKVEYKQTFEEKTMPIYMWHSLNMDDIEDLEPTYSGNMVRYRTKIYDGPTLRRVNPYNFVFDAHEGNFDTAFKCERNFKHYEDLVDSKIYQNLDGLNKLRVQGIYSQNQSTNLSGRDVSSEVNSKGYDEKSRVELLNFFGDICIQNYEDGEDLYLRNYMAVVAARTRLIQFEPNMYMFNPFVKWQYRETDDGWGESILLSTLRMLEKSAEQVTLGCEAAILATHPPFIYPEGMFDEGVPTHLSPGLGIPYRLNSQDPSHRPMPLAMSPNAPFEYLQWFESNTEATTGATRQMSGNVTTTDKEQTATEFQGLQTVGNLILDRIVDLFNLEFKLPIIEKFATLLGYFNPVERNVISKTDAGSSKLQKIPQEAYFGQYHFCLEDSKSELERKGLIKERLGFLMQLLQIPEIGQRLKVEEVAKSIFRDLGYGDPDSLFMTDDEMVTHQQELQSMQQQVQQSGGMPPNPIALRQQNRNEASIMPPQQDSVTGLGTEGML